MFKREAAQAIRPREGIDWRQGATMAALLALLVIFILYPVVRVLWVSLSNEEGGLTLLHFANFFPWIGWLTLLPPWTVAYSARLRSFRAARREARERKTSTTQIT